MLMKGAGSYFACSGGVKLLFWSANVISLAGHG